MILLIAPMAPHLAEECWDFIGEQGMAVMGNELTLIPPRAACAQDVSGAGDTVVAATACGLAAGLTVPEAAWEIARIKREARRTRQT